MALILFNPIKDKSTCSTHENSIRPHNIHIKATNKWTNSIYHINVFNASIYSKPNEIHKKKRWTSDIYIYTFCVYKYMNRGPIHERFFHRISNSTEISFYSKPSGSIVIPMKFCPRHNSSAVVACAKFCSDMMNNNGFTLKHISVEFQFRW